MALPITRFGGAGGDLSLPGAIEYQRLHSDGRDAQHLLEGRVQSAQGLGVELNRNGGEELDVPTLKLIMEMTVPMVTINFFDVGSHVGEWAYSADSGDAYSATAAAYVRRRTRVDEAFYARWGGRWCRRFSR